MQHLEETAGAKIEPGDTVKVFFERRGGIVDYEMGVAVKCTTHEGSGDCCIRMDKPIPDDLEVLRVDLFDEYAT